MWIETPDDDLVNSDHLLKIDIDGMLKSDYPEGRLYRIRATLYDNRDRYVVLGTYYYRNSFIKAFNMLKDDLRNGCDYHRMWDKGTDPNGEEE